MVDSIVNVFIVSWSCRYLGIQTEPAYTARSIGQNVLREVQKHVILCKLFPEMQWLKLSCRT